MTKNIVTAAISVALRNTRTLVVGIGNLLFIADEVDGLIAEGIGCILVQLPQVLYKSVLSNGHVPSP